jgi:hypothetical protein
MFFTYAARILAILASAVGGCGIILGVGIANGWTGLSTEEGLVRYTSFGSTGQLVDQGIFIIFAAVALGTLAEIALVNRNRRDE